MTLLLPQLQTHWVAIRPIFTIRNEQDYDIAINRLEHLLDEVGDNPRHPLYSLLDTLGTIVHAYETAHMPMPAYSGVEMLQYLMTEHGLSQADLSDIGSQGVVSEILNGKRELNIRQIRALAHRFNVSPAVFV